MGSLNLFGRVRGMALAVALLISAVLFILGVAFLSFASNDYFFAGKELLDAQALYLARAGMKYYAASGFPSGSTVSGDLKTGMLDIPPNDSTHYCVISQNLTTLDLTFQGTITNSLGSTSAEKIIVAPGGNLNQWYEK